MDEEALLKLTKQRLRAMADRRVDDKIAEEITRMMMEEAGEKIAEQVSSMKNLCTKRTSCRGGISRRQRR